MRGAAPLVVAVGLLTFAPAATPAPPTTVKVAFLQGEQVVYLDRRGSSLEAAVKALLAGPTAAERGREVTTQVPQGTPLRGVSVSGATASVDLGERFVAGTNAESLTARLTQVVLTATRYPQIRSVRLQVKGGTPLGLFPGVVANRPLAAKDVLAPSSPVPGAPAPGPPGTSTPETRALQERLIELGYLAAGAADGVAGAQTTSAVVAFQKWSGLTRDGVAGPATLARLASATRATPRASGAGRRAEVLLDRQLTLLVDGGRVIRVFDVSSGKPGYETPAGSFRVSRKERNSWSVPYKVWLPWASYFVGGVAFHEYPDVPPTAASHGCVRVPRWDSQWLYEQLPAGTPVLVLARS